MTATSKEKFKRFGYQGNNESDERGLVKIQCVLLTSGPGSKRAQKGNIVRTLTVSDATVSEVIATIEAAIIE